MNIIITSEHRVGSRWLHYLLADALSMDTSPEMDKNKLYKSTGRKEALDYFQSGRIVKYHHATPDKIFKYLKPINYSVIGMVRNPRDRVVSFSLHNRYHKHNFKQKEFDTDLEALKYTALEDKPYKANTKRMYDYMVAGNSTFSTKITKSMEEPYIWTTYEHMKKDIKKELSEILTFLGVGISDSKIEEVIRKNSFKAKSGRQIGIEKRDDLWRRKGIVGDYENWFDEELYEATKEDAFKYSQLVALEHGFRVSSKSQLRRFDIQSGL